MQSPSIPEGTSPAAVRRQRGHDVQEPVPRACTRQPGWKACWQVVRTRCDSNWKGSKQIQHSPSMACILRDRADTRSMVRMCFLKILYRMSAARNSSLTNSSGASACNRFWNFIAYLSEWVSYRKPHPFLIKRSSWLESLGLKPKSSGPGSDWLLPFRFFEHISCFWLYILV